MPVRIASICLLVALAACDATEPPLPEPPPACVHAPLPNASGDEGRILFSSWRDGPPRLFSSRPDGTDLRPHTPPSLPASWGIWSPDRSEILLGTDSMFYNAAAPALYIGPANGTTRDDLRPLYVRPRVRETPDPDSIYGSEGLAFRTLRGFRGSWSPDGSRVAIETCGSFGVACPPNLTIVHLARDTVQVLRDPESRWFYRPVWHPTKQRVGVQFTYDRRHPLAYQILGLRLNTETTDTLTARADSVLGLLSPDWKRAATYRNGEHGFWDLRCQSFEPFALDTHERIVPVSWSPDGTRYAGIRYGSSTRSLYVVDPQAGTATQLFPGDETIGSVDWR